MTIQKPEIPIEKLKTGIAGFDLVSDGGLPQGRTTNNNEFRWLHLTNLLFHILNS